MIILLGKNNTKLSRVQTYITKENEKRAEEGKSDPYQPCREELGTICADDTLQMF
jgi:hypothetical protein